MTERFNSNEEPQEYDQAAFGMGYLCRQNGGPLHANPFQAQSWLGKSWAAGWCDRDMIEIQEQSND